MKQTILRKGSLVLAIAILLSSVMLFAGCTKADDYKDFNYFVMDTSVTIRLAKDGDEGKLSDEYLAEVADACAAILAEVDAVVSFSSESSNVYALNSDINVMVGADPSLIQLLKTAENITKITGGAYDYTLGTLTELWNVKNGGPRPAESDINYATAHTGADKFKISGTTIEKIDKAAKIDLGGIAKGYATQLVLEYLATTDVKYGIVSLGSNIGVYGTKADGDNYKIGVIDPDNTSGVIGHLFIRSGFVSVTGDYELFFEENGVRYHNIMDSSIGAPAASGIRSVAVYSTSGAAADALSTALFVMGLDRALELYESGDITFEAVFVTTDDRIVTTPGIDKDMFISSGLKYKLTSMETGSTK